MLYEVITFLIYCGLAVISLHKTLAATDRHDTRFRICKVPLLFRINLVWRRLGGPATSIAFLVVSSFFSFILLLLGCSLGLCLFLQCVLGFLDFLWTTLPEFQRLRKIITLLAFGLAKMFGLTLSKRLSEKNYPRPIQLIFLLSQISDFL